MIGELQLVFTVRDEDVGGELGVVHTPKYTGAMVELLQWRQRGSVNPVHGMVKVEPWPITIEKKSTISYRRKDIFSGIYYQRGACNPGNIATSTILVCQ